MPRDFGLTFRSVTPQCPRTLLLLIVIHGSEVFYHMESTGMSPDKSRYDIVNFDSNVVMHIDGC